MQRLIRIEDFDLDRMYLIIGQKRAALIDAGWDYDGNLPALCHALTGGLPVDLLIAHGHPDHVAQAGKFIEYGCKVYAPYADKSMNPKRTKEQDEAFVATLTDILASI